MAQTNAAPALTAEISRVAVRLPPSSGHRPAVWFGQAVAQFTLAGISSEQISRVAVRLPPFSGHRPAVWFGQAVAQFTLAGISSEQISRVAVRLPPSSGHRPAVWFAQAVAQFTLAGISSEQISRVAVRLPPFSGHRPAVWFGQAVAQFTLAGIGSEQTKFCHVISQVHQRYAAEVEDIITSPPERDHYTTQNVPGGKVNILGAHSIGQSKQKNCIYTCVLLRTVCEIDLCHCTVPDLLIRNVLSRVTVTETRVWMIIGFFINLQVVTTINFCRNFLLYTMYNHSTLISLVYLH
jgi:hypothetical protein